MRKIFEKKISLFSARLLMFMRFAVFKREKLKSTAQAKKKKKKKGASFRP
jgi:hypothetical protein